MKIIFYNRHSSRGRSFELIAAADEAINDGYICKQLKSKR